jgi:hypothetical protein
VKWHGAKTESGPAGHGGGSQVRGGWGEVPSFT